jgi:outer membrane lipoprotein-sorting protein
MKYFLSLTILILVSFTSLAQDNYEENTKKAKEILDKVSAKTRSYKSISADFTFSMENLQEDISETNTGTILIKGDKYKVSLMGVDTYFDGKVIYTYMEEAEEVNITEPDPEDEETLNPATIFTIYEKGFKYRYIGEAAKDGKTFYEIDLYPENRDKPYSRIKLQILKDDLTLYSLRQIGKDGNNYTVVVNSMKTNIPLDDSAFIFDPAKHPDVDVIDMR